jgi:hypothetical protein
MIYLLRLTPREKGSGFLVEPVGSKVCHSQGEIRMWNGQRGRPHSIFRPPPLPAANSFSVCGFGGGKAIGFCPFRDPSKRIITKPSKLIWVEANRYGIGFFAFSPSSACNTLGVLSGLLSTVSDGRKGSSCAVLFFRESRCVYEISHCKNNRNGKAINPSQSGTP